MQNVSSTYKRIFQMRGHVTEVKAVIGGATYGIDSIYLAEQNLSLFAGNNPEIGCCCAGSMKMRMIPTQNVPRMAEIKLYTRLVSPDGKGQSEWLPAGTYFIDTRNREKNGLAITYNAYDAMLKCDLPYLENTAFDEWPQSEDDIVADIADAIGITVDSRTELAGYDVPYPNDYTMREILGYIGAANGGNWIITPENKLLLVKLKGENSLLGANSNEAILFGDSVIVLSTGYKYDDARALMSADDDDAILFGDSLLVLSQTGIGTDGGPEKTDIYRNAQGFHNLGMLQPFTGVKLWRSHENTYVDEQVETEAEGEVSTETVQVEVEQSVMAGDDSGRVLEADCPWATQEMVDDILLRIEGYCWQGAVVEGAQITPAAELGDTVICDGVGFSLSSISASYTGDYLPTISAPADEEVDYEYHYESLTERKLSRKVSLGDSYYGFKVTRENGIEVVNIVDGNETTRMILNSSIQAFYNADGQEALYFDAEAGQYRFVGDVTILSGSLNINNNFIVDRDGNVTTNGNVTLQGANTTITSPNVYGGKYYNSSGDAYLEIGNSMDFWGASTIGTPLFSVWDSASGYADIKFYGDSILRYNQVAQQIAAEGKWKYTGSGYSGADAEIATLGDLKNFEPLISSSVDVTNASSTVTLSENFNEYAWIVLYGYAGRTTSAGRFSVAIPTVSLSNGFSVAVASADGVGFIRISASGKVLTFISQSYSTMRIDQVYGKN